MGRPTVMSAGCHARTVVVGVSERCAGEAAAAIRLESAESCTLDCIEGYTTAEVTISCSAAALDNEATDHDDPGLVCTRNK